MVALAGNPKLKVRFKISKNNFFDRPQIRRAMDKANRKALSLAGMDIRSAQRSAIGRSPGIRSKTQSHNQANIIMHGGVYRDVSNYGKPRAPGRPIKSYKPHRWVYRALVFAYDPSRRSVVVGPNRTPWLNRLHEFGGTIRQTGFVTNEMGARLAFRRHKEGRPPGKLANGMPDTGFLKWMAVGKKPGRGWSGKAFRNVKIPARPFVGSDVVRKRMVKINQKFRGTLGRVSLYG
jgi:hypothetical protein